MQEDLTGTAGEGRWLCNRRVSIVAAATCCVLLVSSAWFFSKKQLADATAVATDTMPHESLVGNLMQKSHFTQSCSYKCNRKLDGELNKCDAGDRGCPKAAFHNHDHCCTDCSGGKCLYPCSAACNQDYAKALSKCKPGVMGCRKPAAHLHTQCCLKCPFARCIPANPTVLDLLHANATALMR